MTTTKSQNDAVLSRLKRGKLTSIEAFKSMGITRLASRIYDLRKRGYDIVAKKVGIVGVNAYCEYRLNKGK